MNEGRGETFCLKIKNQNSHCVRHLDAFTSRLIAWKDALPWLQWAAMEGTPYGKVIRGQFSSCIVMRERESYINPYPTNGPPC